MKIKQKTILQRLFIGFKKGYETPTLPDHILKLQLHPLIRIIRVLGGLSFLFIILKRYLNYPVYVLYIALFFLFIFTVYHFFLAYHRFFHIKALLKSDKLDIKKFS